MNNQQDQVASRQLHERWQSVGAALRAKRSLTHPVDGLIKPQPAALRARYYALASLPSDAHAAWFDLSWDAWQRQVALVPLGEQALAAGNIDASERYFRELESLARAPNIHPVVLVDALIGLGDAERTRDRTADATRLYEEAERVAAQNGLDFGRVRALVPWLLLERRTRSTEELIPSVDLCEHLARGLDDRMYLANTDLVRSEILSASGDFEGALAAADRAAELFGDHPIALPGLYVRLADAFRMSEDLDGLRRTVLRALAALRKVDQPVEKSAALDLLATVRFVEQQWDSARVAAQAAISVARDCGDGRDGAYAHVTLSKIERKAGNFEAALVARCAATRYFTDRHDGLGSLAYCLIESAELQDLLGRRAEAAEEVRGALTALEKLRCLQARPSAQQEYRRRFAQVYRRGLRLACQMRDPILFVSVFEGLWGRRLAGLTDGAGPQFDDDVILKTHMLAQAKLAGTATEETGRERARRMLGRTALKGALPGMIEDQTDTAIASLSTPYDHALAERHLMGVPRGTAALLLAPVPERPLRYFALIVDAEGNIECDEYEIPQELRTMLDNWRSNPTLSSVDDLALLLTLIPEQVDAIPVGTPLLLVPLEEFWPLPWTAIPLADGTVLGARHPIRMSPSLALAAVTRQRRLSLTRHVCKWIGPDVHAQRLDGLPAAALASASEALRHVVRSDEQQDVIVVAHGVPSEGVGHFLNLGDGLTLSPLQAMGAQPPGRVALISCWGAFVPGEHSGDPLTVATVLQARGAVSVLATSAELRDDIYGAYFIDSLLNDDEAKDWSAALFRTIRATIGYPEFRECLSRWAPIRVLGAW